MASCKLMDILAVNDRLLEPGRVEAFILQKKSNGIYKRNAKLRSIESM